jgi:hypothetical protein
MTRPIDVNYALDTLDRYVRGEHGLARWCEDESVDPQSGRSLPR